MTLKSWWQVTKPHKDIIDNKLDESIFAADLGDVIKGNAPLEYKDALTFFNKTYLTNGLKNLIKNVVSALNGEKADRVIQLQTPFGGGKTHALVILYHLVKNYKEIKHLPSIKEFNIPENAKVAAFIGTHADALYGKTPWGEIAMQLEKYDIIEEHDKQRISPGKDNLRKILESSGPTLILIDELLEYVVKANQSEIVKNIKQGQTLAFLQEITEVVSSIKNACLVFTLPASILETYDEHAEKMLAQMQKVSGRVEKIYTPVEGTEIYEIIRKRLFDDIGSEEIRKEVAQYYFELYQKSNIEVPADAKKLEYRDKIEKAYPFHPEIIDVLYERWGSIPSFQRTRGVLRLLAEIVSDLYEERVTSPLIFSSLLNFENSSIKGELIKHCGNEFDSIITSDIVNKASQIDKSMGSEYEKYRIATSIANSVFMYSFSGSEKKGATLAQIRLAVLREESQYSMIGDAINTLEEQLWYFHSENKLFSFHNKPNLNRIIVEKEESITEETIKENLKNYVHKCAGNAINTYIWVEDPSDIPDTKNIKLIILSPDYLYESQELNNFVTNLFEKTGTSFRIYKNTLFAVAIEKNEYIRLIKKIKNLNALKIIENSKDIIDKLTREKQEELKNKIKNIEKEMPFNILNAYRFVAWLEKNGIVWNNLGIPTSGSTQSISQRVEDYLKDREKILIKITPKYLTDKTLSPDENEKKLEDIYEIFLKTPGMPLLKDQTVLINTVIEGVKNGFFGIKDDSKIYFEEYVKPTLDSILIRSEIARKIKQDIEIGKKSEVEIEDRNIEPIYLSRENDNRIEKEKIEPKDKVVKKVRLKYEIPYDKLYDITRGVVFPLQKNDGKISITIEVEATSESGFDNNTIENKVKETLHQVNAKIYYFDTE